MDILIALTLLGALLADNAHQVARAAQKSQLRQIADAWQQHLLRGPYDPGRLSFDAKQLVSFDALQTAGQPPPGWAWNEEGDLVSMDATGMRLDILWTRELTDDYDVVIPPHGSSFIALHRNAGLDVATSGDANAAKALQTQFQLEVIEELAREYQDRDESVHRPDTVWKTGTPLLVRRHERRSADPLTWAYIPTGENLAQLIALNLLEGSGHYYMPITVALPSQSPRAFLDSMNTEEASTQPVGSWRMATIRLRRLDSPSPVDWWRDPAKARMSVAEAETGGPIR